MGRGLTYVAGSICGFTIVVTALLPRGLSVAVFVCLLGLVKVALSLHSLLGLLLQLSSLLIYFLRILAYVGLCSVVCLFLF